MSIGTLNFEVKVQNWAQVKIDAIKNSPVPFVSKEYQKLWKEQERQKKIQERIQSTIFKKEQRETLSFEKKLTTIKMSYIRQGYDEQEAQQKAFQEASLTGIDAEFARRNRLFDQFQSKQVKALEALLKKESDQKKRMEQISKSVFKGSAMGSALGSFGGSTLAGIAKSMMGSAVSNFNDTANIKNLSERLAFEADLERRFLSQTRANAPEHEIFRQEAKFKKDMADLRLSTGKSVQEIGSIMVTAQDNLSGYIQGWENRNEFIQNLVKKTDSFTSLDALMNEYIGGVQGSKISKGSELWNMAGETGARRYNRFTDNQNLLVQAGFFEDMNVAQLEQQRANEINKIINGSPNIHSVDNAVLGLRKGDIDTDTGVIDAAKAALGIINGVSSPDTIANLANIANQASLLMEGSSLQKMLVAGDILGEVKELLVEIKDTLVSNSERDLEILKEGVMGSTITTIVEDGWEAGAKNYWEKLNEKISNPSRNSIHGMGR